MRIWEEDVLIAEIEELEKLDASETNPWRLNAKEVLITQKDGEFVFLVADGSAKLPGRDYEFQEPTLRREFTVRRENLSGESHGDREEFQPEESEDDAEARKNFWSIQEDFIYRHHIEPRVQLYVLKEESFPIPLKYIDVISEQLKTKRWLLECRRKQKSVRFVDGLHKNYIIERNSSERKCMVQEETDKIETRSHMTWRLDKNWKTKTSVAKTRIQFYWYCRRKTEFCIALQLCARSRSDEKILRKLFT